MTDSLLRSRSGHVSTITRMENATKPILDKNPSTISKLELSKLQYALEKSKSQQEKIEALNEQIVDALATTQASSEDTQSIQEKIDDNDLRIGSFILALEVYSGRAQKR